MSNAELLTALEALSAVHPDRVLRLTGSLPCELLSTDAAALEPFELLIFRGFSSLTTHPTAFDPDRPALNEQALISAAELLAAPLAAGGGVRLAGPLAAELFLIEARWL